MGRELFLTTNQVEALQGLHAAASHAAASFAEEPEDYLGRRVDHIAKDAQEALLIAMGHPPAWMERMDREIGGTPLRKSSFGTGCLRYGVASILHRLGVLTLEELAERSIEEVRALPGIGPRRLEEITAALAAGGLEFAALEEVA